MLFFSPLEQFEIIPILFLKIGSVDISFTNSSLFLFICFFVFFCFFKMIGVSGGYYIPSRYQAIIEAFYLFTLDIVKENIGRKGESFFPFVFCLFIFLVFTNTCGLIPYSFTVTSHLVITFALSALVWFGKLFIGVKFHGVKILGILLPSGIPFGMVPFFVLVELLSFFIPLAALGIRLFANMMAGHILLKVIVGFCWSIIVSGGMLFIAHFIPISVLFILLFLETAVAFIQAYVFAILTCLITGDIIKGGHLFVSSSSEVERLAVNQIVVGSSPT